MTFDFGAITFAVVCAGMMFYPAFNIVAGIVMLAEGAAYGLYFLFRLLDAYVCSANIVDGASPVTGLFGFDTCKLVNADGELKTPENIFNQEAIVAFAEKYYGGSYTPADNDSTTDDDSSDNN